MGTVEYATEKEMIAHCEKYPCSTCIIAHKCQLFEIFFSYLPKSSPNPALEPTNTTEPSQDTE